MEYIRALNRLPINIEAQIQLSDVFAYSAYGVQTHGPFMRAVARGTSVEQLKLGIDHIDLPINFNELLVHRDFWEEFVVLHDNPQRSKPIREGRSSYSVVPEKRQVRSVNRYKVEEKTPRQRKRPKS